MTHSFEAWRMAHTHTWLFSYAMQQGPRLMTSQVVSGFAFLPSPLWSYPMFTLVIPI